MRVFDSGWTFPPVGVNGSNQFFKTKNMRNALQLFVSTGLLVAVAGLAPAADEKATFSSDKEKASYAVGMTFGSQIKRAGFEVDVDVVAAAMRDVLAGKEPRLKDTEAREAIMSYQQASRQKAAEKNKKLGEAFLAENKKKAGVKTHSVTLADGKTAELQYKVISEGNGPKPNTNDIVKVNYRGTLIDGKEFDSSAKHGQPASFPLNRVIRGWTEGLQLMKVGSKYEFYIPSDLAYGDSGSGPMIEPGSTLIFEVELLSAEPPPPPAAPATQPMTSDIIRVPSAEELKKGAKIEVIKPEDVEKMQKDAAKK